MYMFDLSAGVWFGLGAEEYLVALVQIKRQAPLCDPNFDLFQDIAHLDDAFFHRFTLHPQQLVIRILQVGRQEVVSEHRKRYWSTACALRAPSHKLLQL